MRITIRTKCPDCRDIITRVVQVPVWEERDGKMFIEVNKPRARRCSLCEKVRSNAKSNKRQIGIK